jgi:hypothetical protein
MLTTAVDHQSLNGLNEHSQWENSVSISLIYLYYTWTLLPIGQPKARIMLDFTEYL